jgi:hypothetical protein
MTKNYPAEQKLQAHMEHKFSAWEPWNKILILGEQKFGIVGIANLLNGEQKLWVHVKLKFNAQAEKIILGNKNLE